MTEQNYVITHLLAGHEKNRAQGHDATSQHWEKHLAPISDHSGLKLSEDGRLSGTFRAESSDIDHAKSALGSQSHDVLVEPAINMHHHADRQDAVHKHALKQMPAGMLQAKKTSTPDIISVTVTTDQGAPIAGVAVTVVALKGKIPRSLIGTTNAQGVAEVSGFEAGETVAMITAMPRSDYWSMQTTQITHPLTITCPPLPRTGPWGWWHSVLDATARTVHAGKGIVIGVIDTGCGPSPQLAHIVDGGAIIDQNWSPDGADVGIHGTFSCGVIGAHPINAGDYAGLAQGAQIASIRVYPNDTAGANQLDVALAIDRMTHAHNADLINLSLYSHTPSDIQNDAIHNALRNGSVCICSAGNTGTSVGWPAASPQAVAVSGLGQTDCAPEGTIDSIFVPTDAAHHGDDALYLATFSCSGPELTVAGPAVAALAPVPLISPDLFSYAAMSGTSVAAPMICGALGVWLSENEEYLGLPRDGSRSAMACQILMDKARAIGMDPNLVGAGIVPVKAAAQ